MAAAKSSLNDIFGARLKALRKAQGLTQEELGRAAKIDYKHLSGIERGVQPPSFAAVERIAKILKVEFFELFLPQRKISGEVSRAVSLISASDVTSKKEAITNFFDELAIAVHHLEDRLQR